DSFQVLSERSLGKYWDGKKKVFGPRVQSFFDQLEFLKGLEPEDGKPDPMQEDWENCREFGLSLLKLGHEFADFFTAAKKAAGGVDFHDLEQLALRLLANEQNEPTSLALELRERFDQIFVDEYQDINQAQDLIIRSLSKPASIGNTFLVGDVKQSIYSFREADPRLFQGYGKNILEWKCISLQDNFRSSEGILKFVNGFFGWLMSGKASGVEYDSRAELIFGNAEARTELAISPGQIDVELHLIKSEVSEERETEETDETPELSGTEQEARLVANRLRELKDSGFEIFCQKEKRHRPVEWSDMVVLLRAISAKAEVYSKAFNEAGIPLHIKRSSFFETREALDLCSLLQILDNPLQDIPLVAVLRSPLVGLSANELGWIRASSREKAFWRALLEFHKSQVNASGWGKVDRFLKQFYSWRDSKSVASLGQRLEIILADTQYMEWVAFQPRGKERVSNIQHLLGIARNFDEVRNESLYLFLRHIELLQEVAGDIEPPPSATGDCVRLMTIHQSKGLEFPIVAVPDLGKPMNFSDSQKSILLDDRYGLCLKAQVNLSTYPTLPQWLAARESKAKTIAEEMRVLYVALTRAENRLLLFGTAQKKSFDKWQELGIERPFSQEMLRTKSMLDWVGSFLTYKGVDWVDTSAPGETTNPFTMQADGLPAIKLYTEVAFEQQQVVPEERLFDADLISQLRAELPFTYAYQPATEEAAKTTVTALRRKEESEDRESRVFFGQGKSDGRERGLAYHKLFQEIDLEGSLDQDGSKKQAERLRKAGRMTDAELKHIDFTAFARFWQSPIGLEILETKEFVKREVPFTANLDQRALSRLNMDHSLSIPKDDFVVVQGIADLIVLLKKEIWLLDFKTDHVKKGNVHELTTTYKPQLNLYAHALSSIYDRPVTRKILYFVSSGTISEWH
ncbi:MAG: 3'-5' exonuclease, partial [Verrucomicrobiota bacterium]